MSKAYIQQQIRRRGKAAVMVMLSADAKADSYVAALSECFESVEQPALYLKNLGVVYGQVSQKGWEKLQGTIAASDDVAGTAPMQPIAGLGSTATVPTTPQVAWGVAKIQAPALWKQGLSGKGVLVAHLDTGMDGEHPALKPAIAQFADFDATGHRIEGAPIADSDVHGSHTAGIIAGRTVFRAGNRCCARLPTGERGGD